ncbi:MAG TPA: hypothetical protein VN577_15730 [Terriglobales bacterium]|nr:hypothetical protein [Terriglobales bacterium]
MKVLLNSAALRQHPVWGTVAFAVFYAILAFLVDWLFRWTLGGNPRPPLWTLIVTIGIGTTITSVIVYLLLVSIERQNAAIQQLNHELRNALQILSYAVQQCDGETAPKADAAIQSMSATLRRISQDLGTSPKRRFRSEGQQQ